MKNPVYPLMTFLWAGLSLSLATALAAQNPSDWNNVAHIQQGEKVTLSVSNRGPVTGAFQSWTPEQVTVANVSANKQDVVRVELLQSGGRGRHAAIGAAVGFGAGFGIGAAAGGNCHGFGPCISRGEAGGVIGAVGGVVGALVGALLPSHHRELIYAAK